MFSEQMCENVFENQSVFTSVSLQNFLICNAYPISLQPWYRKRDLRDMWKRILRRETSMAVELVFGLLRTIPESVLFKGKDTEITQIKSPQPSIIRLWACALHFLWFF